MHLFLVYLANDIRFIFLRAFFRLIRVANLSSFASQEFRPDQTLRILSPKVSFERLASFLSHGALNTSFHHCVAFAEDVIVIESTGFEASYLSFNIEGVNENDVYLIGFFSAIRTIPRGQVSEVRAALNPDPLRIEAYVLELVEIKPRDKLFIWT